MDVMGIYCVFDFILAGVQKAQRGYGRGGGRC